MKYLVLIALLLFSQFSYAANTWYYGNVTNIITHTADGSFIITIDNPTIKATCAYDRVEVSVSNLGAERTKAALSMALSAFLGDKRFGIVVNLPAPGSVCVASPTTNQGAGITD